MITIYIIIISPVSTTASRASGISTGRGPEIAPHRHPGPRYRDNEHGVWFFFYGRRRRRRRDIIPNGAASRQPPRVDGDYGDDDDGGETDLQACIVPRPWGDSCIAIVHRLHNVPARCVVFWTREADNVYMGWSFVTAIIYLRIIPGGSIRRVVRRSRILLIINNPKKMSKLFDYKKQKCNYFRDWRFL